MPDSLQEFLMSDTLKIGLSLKDDFNSLRKREDGFVLYGMISAIGVRNVVENKVDFTNSRNLIIAAVILVCALGFNSVGGISFALGNVTINLSGLAIAAIAGILLNAILPGNDYEFDEGSNEPESASLRV